MTSPRRNSNRPFIPDIEAGINHTKEDILENELIRVLRENKIIVQQNASRPQIQVSGTLVLYVCISNALNKYYLPCSNIRPYRCFLKVTFRVVCMQYINGQTGGYTKPLTTSPHYCGHEDVERSAQKYSRGQCEREHSIGFRRITH